VKIERKIILSYIFNIAFIVLIGIFSLNNMNLVLTKLRFVEIADDLNSSFLEMRISEKNYFLYKDRTALDEINNKISSVLESVETTKADITRAIGEDNLSQLKIYLNRYARAIEELRSRSAKDLQSGSKLRAEGQKLREFFKTITKLERNNVNDLILRSKEVLYISFLIILLLSVIGGRIVSRNIVNSMREIEGLAVSISKGDFTKIEDIASTDECGSVIRAINIMSEELKNREEEIIQSKKLASLGTLTAGVAHELRNPLNNISMVAQNFVDMYDSLSRDQRIELMGRVEEETKRIEEIVKNLLDFAKPKVADLKEADINSAIRKAVQLMQNTLDISNIELTLSLDSSVPHVFIDRPQMQQVLVNLILNAVQSMSPGGKLFIKTHAVGEDSVTIEVRDTGKGIPPEFLPHIFDPFFSTKGVEGTGLGLSISYGIIRNHRGTIRVESAVNAGTAFTIELPVHKKQEEKYG
jgi:two-component system, NtrC family, sensor kinase